VANWVGQGRAKPVTSFSTAAQTLAYTKIAAISVITEELARFSSPSAEMLVRDELARAVIERMDIDFIDPAQAAVANVSPASITNGLTALTSAGTAEANIRTDLTNLLSTFVENNIDPTNLVLLMPNTLALAASLMVNSLGQPSFPGINTTGGALMGIPVITSQYLANASGAGNLVIAVNASDIFVADDGQVTLDASREASIEMSDAPLGNSGVPTASSVSVVSMYQTNSIAIRAERYINWVKGRSNSVVYMDDVNWGSVGSPA
jgi:HK97 family phage major capsid protein